MATHGVLDEKILKELVHGHSGDAAAMVEKLVQEQIESHLANKISLSKFRTELSSFALELSKSSDTPDRVPLIIMVDELDRCRPTYAVELLERLKHLFNVDGILFVLAIDHNALAHSVRAVYGEGFDAIGYLRRFIDFSVSISTPDPKDFCEATYRRMQFDKVLQQRPVQRSDAEQMIDFLATFAKAYRFSLRTIEQVMSEIYALVAMTPQNKSVLLPQVALMTILRHATPVNFSRFMDGRASAEQFFQELKEEDQTRIILGPRSGLFVRAYLFEWSSVEGETKEEIGRLVRLSDDQKATDVERGEAQEMRQIFTYLNQRDVRDLSGYLKRRVALMQSFKPGV